jgi:hypothetical protein
MTIDVQISFNNYKQLIKSLTFYMGNLNIDLLGQSKDDDGDCDDASIGQQKPLTQLKLFAH